MKSQELAQASARPEIQVSLPAFEGPFDLLIYLVERDKLDIYSIAVADITNSYLSSLSLIEFDPELASDFIYMAAYLLELKSRSLLPRFERELLADEPDPRQELILRLVEYKRFKKLAARLAEMISPDNYDHVRRPAAAPEQGPRVLAPLSLDNLFLAFTRALAREQAPVREFLLADISIEKRLAELRLTLGAKPVRFSELAGGQSLAQLVVTFLALLELVRLGEVAVCQEQVFAPILIKATGKGGDHGRQ